MKSLLLLLVLIVTTSHAGLNYSTDGKILDPGMYWAIHARNELTDVISGKGNSKKVMKHLMLSASYGFKDAMLSISAIYQNGDYGFEKDLPRAFAWSVMANGKNNKTNNPQFDFLNEKMSPEQHQESKNIVKDIHNTYSQKATFKKFTQWYKEISAVTGSKLAGNHSYLNVQITTNTGRRLTAFEFYNQIQKIYNYHELDNQEIIQHEIIPVED